MTTILIPSTEEGLDRFNALTREQRLAALFATGQLISIFEKYQDPNDIFNKHHLHTVTINPDEWFAITVIDNVPTIVYIEDQTAIDIAYAYNYSEIMAAYASDMVCSFDKPQPKFEQPIHPDMETK